MYHFSVEKVVRGNARLAPEDWTPSLQCRRCWVDDFEEGSTLKALRRKAQGCPSAVYPGNSRHRITNPEGVAACS